MNDIKVIMPEQWGEYIRLYRALNNLTQVEFGVLVDCTGRCVSEWETGKTCPQKNKQIKLREVLAPLLDSFAENGMIQQKKEKQAEQYPLKKANSEFEVSDLVKHDLMMQIMKLDDKDILLIADVVKRLSSK